MTTRRSCLSAALAGLLLAPAAAPAARVAEVQLFQPACSQADPARAAKALAEAGALLQAHCGLGLHLLTRTALPLESGFCHLPDEPQARHRAVAALVAALPRARPRCLALVLLPDGADPRLSWALVDVSPRGGCGSPQEARFLNRFGALLVSDGALASHTPPASLLLLHEALHALTQRRHPSGAARGEALADALADMGPGVSPELCACAAQSPYLVDRP